MPVTQAAAADSAPGVGRSSGLSHLLWVSQHGLQPGGCGISLQTRERLESACDKSRPTSAELRTLAEELAWVMRAVGNASAMVVRALGHVGFNTALFSGISARQGGLSTAIEAGVPEAILWMQSGHAQDVAARRYVQLRSPKLLNSTREASTL